VHIAVFLSFFMLGYAMLQVSGLDPPSRLLKAMSTLSSIEEEQREQRERKTTFPNPSICANQLPPFRS